MRRISIMITFMVFSMVFLACAHTAQKEPTIELKTFNEKSSYVGGMDIGSSLKTREQDVVLPVLIRGIEDAFQGKEPLITKEEAAQIKNEYARKVREENAAKALVQAEKNMGEGKAFLAENAKKPEVMTTKSGLQYMVLNQGNGPKPGKDDQVKVHYVGNLIDGTEFDSSYKRNAPAAFNLNRVIKGWGEGLQLMPVGSKYRFFIPPDLAYGERSAGPKIGPNSTLIFEVELLEIVK